MPNESIQRWDDAIDEAECYLFHGLKAIKKALAEEGLKEADTGAALAAFMLVAQRAHDRMEDKAKGAAKRAGV
ncbi:hypothetical protein [Paraburkholderia sp. 40]|uniref:hypothetical protein n=1 Tax=Paraburkholderia sp. 40 TaxID=2991059 RepID=UPI003D25201D